MPQITEATVDGFCHCRDARCDGYSQQPVQVVRTVRDEFYTDNGGDVPGTERSFTYVSFADQDDIPCPSCGEDREASEQSRPSYQALTPYGQKGLLTAPRFDPAKKVADAKTEALESEVGELKAMVAKLLEAKAA